MFYRNADYFAFVERARAIGITVPIVAGIMPITNVAQIERIAKLSGAAIPADLQADLDRTRSDEAGAREIGSRMPSASAASSSRAAPRAFISTR